MTLKNSTKSDILFYQKMRCTFKLHGVAKKQECIVYCQKAKHIPLSLGLVAESIMDGRWMTIDFLYYSMFLVMVVGFFFANRVCTDGRQPQGTFTDYFCAQKESLSLNFGVLFLCMVVFRSFYKNY